VRSQAVVDVVAFGAAMKDADTPPNTFRYPSVEIAKRSILEG
jgi:hypothetical protein